MALIVETGQAGSDSESYESVVNCDTFMLNRGQTLWSTLTLNDKEFALRRATDYMQEVYRLRWEGTRLGLTQALDWPRYLVPRRDVIGGYRAFPTYYDQTSVPTEVKRACMVLALKAAAGELAPDLTPPVISESIGPISVTYAAGARQIVTYRAIDNVLAPLLKGGGGNSIQLIRA